ncbi:MAG: hypothetical protein HY537_09850 [Deltaproteobacteria bacterium]|nr:hypothetical protein [Deltaproteobacteria bacterium]
MRQIQPTLILATLILVLSLCGARLLWCSDCPKVDRDIKTYDEKIHAITMEFTQKPANPVDKDWVKAKLSFMVAVDQYTRRYLQVPFQHAYTDKENMEFQKQFSNRMTSMDARNTADLKDLLKKYEWFTISVFGSQADNDAWLLVQHADQDRPFQKRILNVLEGLYKIGHTKPSNYAYLYDRVARGENPPRPQRYGTQGRCVGPGKWEPHEIEDAANVDKRRAKVGLGTMEEYKAMFKDICHKAEGVI